MSAVFIGFLGALAQLLPAQHSDKEVGWITRNDEFRRRFRDLLLVPKPDLAVGWQLARDLGRPVAPLLWQMVRAEKSNVDRRLVLLAAAVLAGGEGEDDRLFAYLDQAKPMLEERAMACLLLALGPRRWRAQPDFWRRCLGPSKNTERLLEVAARLAAARFTEVQQGAPSSHDASDPGLMAATAFAGLSLSAAQIGRQWRRDGRDNVLFWRGALLGEHAQLDAGRRPLLLDRAQQLLQRSEDGLAAARAAAILLRAHAGVLDPKGGRPSFELLRSMCGQSASIEALRRWLPVTPLPRDDHGERLGVAYALWMPIERVLATRAEWGAESRIRSQLAIAFAFRLLGEPTPMRIEVELPDVPEWAFVRWASGGRMRAVPSGLDPHLASLAALIAANRIDRTAARAALEEVLWRWRCHPNLSTWEQERLLVRDLLLSGSNYGGGMYLPHVRKDQRYFPTGLDRNDKFFRTAVELYEFTERPVSPVPRQHRLR